MIPKIKHSRSQLYSHLNTYEEGACSFFVSSDTYPELFEIACRDIVSKSPHGWRSSQGGNMKYLWFPSLDDDDVERTEDWVQRFKQYVIVGLNEHIEDHFSDELDFCLALDFNRVPQAKRTVYGEAVYQLKYQEERKHNKILADGLLEAFEDLPIPTDQNALIGYVPTKRGERSVPRGLAKIVSRKLGKTLVRGDLTCPKTGLKGVSVDQKIPIWEDLYENGCVTLDQNVTGRTVVIVDDLYQSGATMWMYARHLKQQGAKYVFGLPCVKTLKDSDNQ